MLGFFLGLFYASGLEWFIHKHVFHKMGKKKGSIWAYHLKGHHVISKKNNFIDDKMSLAETVGMYALIAVHIPILFISPWFFSAILCYAVAFNVMHGYQHRHREFTKKWMPWHWEHHMKDSNKNFGVVAPWFDYIMGTRKKYLNKVDK